MWFGKAGLEGCVGVCSEQVGYGRLGSVWLGAIRRGKVRQVALGKVGQRKVWFGLETQVSTGEAWWSMVRCGGLWFVNAGMVWLRKFGFRQVRSGNAGQARRVFVRSGRVW